MAILPILPMLCICENLDTYVGGCFIIMGTVRLHKRYYYFVPFFSNCDCVILS